MIQLTARTTNASGALLNFTAHGKHCIATCYTGATEIMFRAQGGGFITVTDEQLSALIGELQSIQALRTEQGFAP